MENEKYFSEEFQPWISNLIRRWYFWGAGILAAVQIGFHQVADLFFKEVDATRIKDSWTLTALHTLQACTILIALVVLRKARLARPKPHVSKADLLAFNQDKFVTAYAYIWVSWFLLYVMLAGFSFALQNRIRNEFVDVDIDAFRKYGTVDLRVVEADLELGYQLKRFTSDEKGTLPALGTDLFAVQGVPFGYSIRYFDHKSNLHSEVELHIGTADGMELKGKVGEEHVHWDGEQMKHARAAVHQLQELKICDKLVLADAEYKEAITCLATILKLVSDPVATAEVSWSRNGPHERVIRRLVRAFEMKAKATSNEVLDGKFATISKLLKYRSLSENTLNNLQTLAMYQSYAILSKPFQSMAAAKLHPFGITVVALAALLQFFGILGESKSPWLDFFGTVSAVGGGVIFALLIARFESKKFGAPTLVIVTLFTYAVLQTGWALERNPNFAESMTQMLYGAYLLLKLEFFFYVLWLLQSGYMLYYFHVALLDEKSGEKARTDFLKTVEAAAMWGSADSKPAAKHRGRKKPRRQKHDAGEPKHDAEQPTESPHTDHAD